MALATAILTLVGSLVPVVSKLISDSNYTEEQARKDAGIAVDAFLSTVAAMPAVIAGNDAEADRANE